MTISDEPDEDADSPDDSDMVGSYDGTSLPGLGAGADSVAAPRDWPSSRAEGPDLAGDAKTFAWFRANHPDWTLEVGTMLRAWRSMRMSAAPEA